MYRVYVILMLKLTLTKDKTSISTTMVSTSYMFLDLTSWKSMMTLVITIHQVD